MMVGNLRLNVRLNEKNSKRYLFIGNFSLQTMTIVHGNYLIGNLTYIFFLSSRNFRTKKNQTDE